MFDWAWLLAAAGIIEDRPRNPRLQPWGGKGGYVS